MSPTSSPATIVAAARRTSPGFRPKGPARSMSTSTSSCGTSVEMSTCSLVAPSTSPQQLVDLAGLCAQDVEVGAEQPDHDRLAAAGHHPLPPPLPGGLPGPGQPRG